MSMFKPVIVPRTNVASHNPILFENGRGKQGFYPPGSKYFLWEQIPHDNKQANGKPSIMKPVPHFHLLQDETLEVASGSGYWIAGGKKMRLTPGQEITIPRFISHRFESIPNEKEEPLVFLFRYDAERYEMEERFFRNTLTYLDDCGKHNIAPSLLQIAIFMADAWMPPDIIQCPGGDYVRCAVNALMMWVMAFIGMFVFGYKRSYIEYYDPEISRKRMMDGAPKAE